MDIDVYCDESNPDLLSSRKPQAHYLCIGSIWLPTDKRTEYKQHILELKDKHRIGSEFKWNKVSRSRYDFYQELIDWFFDQGENLRFRCIAVDIDEIDLRYHKNDQELGFYKFYYQMLHQWIMDFNRYSIFCDFKENRFRNRLHVLHRCLSYANISAEIQTVQSVRSEESVLIQLSDVLTGLASSKLNESTTDKGLKQNLISYTELKLDHPIRHTALCEKKFNIFVIDLHGGW